MSTRTNANQSEETRVYNNVKANVVAVTLPKGIDGRVTISLDCEPFPSIDFETGEEITKSAFGINIRNLVNQVGEKVEAIGLANALAMGKAINPQIIRLNVLFTLKVHNVSKAMSYTQKIVSLAKLLQLHLMLNQCFKRYWRRL